MSKPNRPKVPEPVVELEIIHSESKLNNQVNPYLKQLQSERLNPPKHLPERKNLPERKHPNSFQRNSNPSNKYSQPNYIDRRSTPHRYLNSFLHPSKKQVSKIRNYNQLLEYLALPNNQKLDPREFLQIHPNDLGEEVFKDDFFEEVQDYNNRKNLRIAAMKMKNLKKLKEPTQSLTRRKLLEKNNKRGGKKTRKGHKSTRKGKMKKRSRSRKFIPKHY